MIKKILKKVFLVFYLILIAPLSAQAAYLAVSRGNAEVQVDGFEEASARKIGLGFGEGKIKFELSSLKLGKFQAKEAFLAEIRNRTGITVDSASAKITGKDISLLSITPLSDIVSLQARIGLYMWELESDQRFLSYGFGNGDSSKDGKDRSLGIGLAFTLGDEAALTLMFDRYEAFQTDFEFLNAGIRLGF